jgi:hypothetical protein
MPAFAQTPKAEIFGGYSFAHQDDLNINKGWNASIAGNFNTPKQTVQRQGGDHRRPMELQH